MPSINIRNAAGKIVGVICDELGTTEITQEWADTKPTLDPEDTATLALEETSTDDERDNGNTA